MQVIRRHLPEVLLGIFVVAYSIYFSLLTIKRAEKLYAHYFDLGIMHQTVYNTYKAIQTVDPSRILELTDPHNTTEQVKRMAIHNDIFLALLAPFYFIHAGFETILVIQTVVLAIGAVFVFLIARKVLKEVPYAQWLALIFSVSYLLYPPMQKANKFDFHSVTLATTFLLAMFYYLLDKKYTKSFIFFILSLLTKEQVGMTTGFFGLYILYEQYKHHRIQLSSSNLLKSKEWIVKEVKKHISTRFAVLVMIISLVWIVLSMFLIIPLSRGEEHFASGYYNHIKERPLKIITYPFRPANIEYAVELFGPVGFLPVASPIQLLVALPEFGINLLSSNSNMRNTYFHYDSVLTPFIFISSIYGVLFIYTYISKHNKKIPRKLLSMVIGLYVLSTAVLFAYKQGPLPYAKQADLYPWHEPKSAYYDVIAWSNILDDDQIKVSTTGKISPHFTSRQYFYDFSWKYKEADYVVIEEHDAQFGYLKSQSIPAYKDLQNDKNYIKIYDMNGIEVYRKVNL